MNMNTQPARRDATVRVLREIHGIKFIHCMRKLIPSPLFGSVFLCPNK